MKTVTSEQLINHVKTEIERLINTLGVYPESVANMLCGVWVKRTWSLTEDDCIDNTKQYSIFHFDFTAALHDMLKIMNENNIPVQDIDHNPSSLYDLNISIRTKEHCFDYYPVMICTSLGEQDDDYEGILSGVTDLQNTYCQE